LDEGLVDSITRAIYWNTVFRVVGIGLQLVNSVVVVSALGLDLYAGFIVITAFVNSLVFFNGFGYGLTFVRYLPELRIRNGLHGLIRGSATLLSIRAIGTIVLIILVKAAFPTISGYLSIGPVVSSHVDIALVLFAVITFGSALEIILRAFLKQKEIGIIRTVRTIAFPCIVISIYLLEGLNLSKVLLAMVTGESLALALGVVFVSRFLLGERARNKHEVPGNGEGESLLRKAATFSGVSIVTRILDYLAGYNFVVMLLATVLGAPEIAVFGLGYRFVSRAFVLVNAPQERLGTPIFANVKSIRGSEGLKKTYRLLLKLNLFTVLPVGVLLLPVLGPAMSFLYPDEFVGAVGIAQLFTIQMTMISLFGVSRSLLMVTEKYGPIIMASFLNLSILPLSIVAASEFGAIGAVLALTLVRSGVVLAYTYFAQSKLETHFPFNFAGRIIWGLMVISPLIVISIVYNLDIIWAVLLFLAMCSVLLWVFRMKGGLDEETSDLLRKSNIPGNKFALKIFTRSGSSDRI
jgi:O-antigen/teichoic acid export membrane protein